MTSAVGMGMAGGVAGWYLAAGTSIGRPVGAVIGFAVGAALDMYFIGARMAELDGNNLMMDWYNTTLPKENPSKGCSRRTSRISALEFPRSLE